MRLLHLSKLTDLSGMVHAKSYYHNFAESLDELDYARDIFKTVGYNNEAIMMIVKKASQNGEVIYNHDGIIFSLGKLKYYTPNK